MNIPSSYRANWFSADDAPPVLGVPFSNHYPVLLNDGCRLDLPLIPLPGGEKAVALLMSNQTTFEVQRHIVGRLAQLVKPIAPEAVVGIPTLGLTYAGAVADAIGLPDFVALGYSRKFWYDDVLNTGNAMSSAIRLLCKAQANIAGIVTVLTEGWDWHRILSRIDS